MRVEQGQKCQSRAKSAQGQAGLRHDRVSRAVAKVEADQGRPKAWQGIEARKSKVGCDRISEARREVWQDNAKGYDRA